MTRTHEFVRQGSSVRGAIDLCLTARQLARLREIDDPGDPRYPECFWAAMSLALSGRLLVDEAAGVDATSVLREIWELRFVLADALAEPGLKSARGPRALGPGARPGARARGAERDHPAPQGAPRGPDPAHRAGRRRAGPAWAARPRRE